MAAYYTFEDLSGSTGTGVKTDNPYHDLIESCDNDPAKIQAKYNTHRTNRNAQQKDKLLSPAFSGVIVDEILAKLENPKDHPDYKDPRHCLVFWARPTSQVKGLIAEVQSRLKEAVPNLWVMPPNSLHMTALEITHSLTAPEIDALVEQMLPHADTVTNYTLNHRSRLVRPMVSFDAQALALSWLPADAEPGRSEEEDKYTYHHLRRDLFTLASNTGVKVASRYVIPTAHLTIGRFIQTADFEGQDGKVDGEKVKKLVEKIEEINEWLQGFWPKEGGGKIKEGGEWVVGQEKGLEFRKGALWYGGGGETVMVGKGF
ncbi:hypothetical protein PRZ48_010881 [Zasmidium cellare]|uniref:RNA ligase/cyclic nucleotide phosphodiesterase n=1 Tax=Zasmidium cellare TaxID=395010 RepID=A0ABR0EA75_ZASCE|nr:hypothetical protein PRZ48_010881 [Zasmidium cellare]